MKIIILFLVLNQSAFASSKVKVERKNGDDVYAVPDAKAEILLGTKAPPIKSSDNVRPDSQYFVGLSRGSLNYKLPSFVGSNDHFSPMLIGLRGGRKISNHLSALDGYYEVSGEWQRFKRDYSIYSQKIDLFQLAFFQNLNLYWPKKQSFLISAGLGIAPLYANAEQSVLGNSISSLGGMGLLKFDLIFPIKKINEIDFEAKAGWGKISGNDIFLSQIGLGINFD